MNFVKAFTPKNTEEVKPGVFLQKTKRGYRQIHPAAWNGKINYKNLLLGPNFLKSFMWFAIILFIAWSYFQDVQTYQEFYEEVNSNPIVFCSKINPLDFNQYESSNTVPNNDGEDIAKIFPG